MSCLNNPTHNSFKMNKGSTTTNYFSRWCLRYGLIWLVIIIDTISLCNAQSINPKNVKLDTLVDWLSTRMQTPELDTITLRYGHIALKRASKVKDTLVTAQSYYNLAEWHNFHYNFFGQANDSAIYYGKKGIETYRALDSLDRVAEQYHFLSFDLVNLGRLNEAEDAAFASIALSDSLGNATRVARNFLELSRIYAKSQDTLKALDYAKKAQVLFRELNITFYDPITYSRLTEAYLLNVAYEKTIATANSAIASFEQEYGDTKYTDADYFHMYQFRGDAYLKLGKDENAIADYEHILNLSNQHFDGLLNSIAHTSLGKIYRKQGKYKKALMQLQKSEVYVTTHKDETTFFYEEMALTHEGLKNYRDALRYQRLNEATKLLELKQKNQSLQSELLAKYESAQKDDQIALQQLQLKQKSKIQWLSLGIASLLVLLLGGVLYAFRNNSRKNLQLKQLNKDLTKRNSQNELLLKEIHHRVKNNLQTISSLLSLQSSHIENPKVLNAVAESRSRVLSMALIHQKLYQGENLAAVEMKDFLQTLGENLVDTYGIDLDKVVIEYPMDKVEMDLDDAIPIGLIANELITNAFKYAFPDNRNGTVKVSLVRHNEKNYSFKVSDNGVGLEADTKAKKSGFGSQLIQLLVQQIGGQLNTKKHNGYNAEINFSIR